MLEIVKICEIRSRRITDHFSLSSGTPVYTALTENPGEALKSRRPTQTILSLSMQQNKKHNNNNNNVTYLYSVKCQWSLSASKK